MQSETLTVVSGILIALITAVSSVSAAYWVFRGKDREAKASENVAEITSEAGVDRAMADLQVQLAKAAENMVEPLNRRIEEQSRKIDRQYLDIEQLQLIVRQQSNKIEALERENIELKKEVEQLKVAKQAAEKRADRIAGRLQKIKNEIDTGPLSSGIHKIPKDNE